MRKCRSNSQTALCGLSSSWTLQPLSFIPTKMADRDQRGPHPREPRLGESQEYLLWSLIRPEYTQVDGLTDPLPFLLNYQRTSLLWVSVPQDNLICLQTLSGACWIGSDLQVLVFLVFLSFNSKFLMSQKSPCYGQTDKASCFNTVTGWADARLPMQSCVVY